MVTMPGIHDASDIPVWDIPWTLLAILAAGIFMAALPFGLALARAADRKAPSPTSPGLGENAPSAQAPPAPARTGARQLTRNQQLCVQFGHVVPDWGKTPTHLICVRCEESWKRVAEDDFDCHVEQAIAIANPQPEPDDEVALADLALWEIENDWATS